MLKNEQISKERVDMKVPRTAIRRVPNCLLRKIEIGARRRKKASRRAAGRVAMSLDEN